MDLLNLILAFLEGIALIISPCILPVLPIILSGSIESGKKRPFGIIIGFITSFVLFTLFSKSLLELFNVNLNIIRNISFGLLITFGIIMLSNYLTEIFDLLTSRIANIGASWKIFQKPNQGFLSGLIFGGLVGLIWTPCAGPILAAVILQTILQKTNFQSLLTITSFAIGASIPMLMIAVFGREIINKLSFFKTRAVLLRRILGCIIIISVLYMIYGYGFTFTFSKPQEGVLPMQTSLMQTINNPYPMPRIEGIEAWINSAPLKNEDLKNKVTLIDFWDYSCINCIRTLPYLKDWYKKYHDKGLVIIGIHSPEFSFEKNLDNVKKAVASYGIEYPVALDNKFETWINFRNHYWPAHYLVNKDGMVIYQHFGEGDYDILENNIRLLLGMNRAEIDKGKELRFPQTPETYLGYARMDRFFSPEEVATNANKKYSYQDSLPTNYWELQGNWTILAEYIRSEAPDSKIKLHFSASKVYAVIGNATEKSITVKIIINNDLNQTKLLNITNSTLYTIVDTNNNFDGTVELIASQPGLEIYTFTFG